MNHSFSAKWNSKRKSCQGREREVGKREGGRGKGEGGGEEGGREGEGGE